MKVNLNVPDQMVADALDSASSTWWAEIVDYPDTLKVVKRELFITLDEQGDEAKPFKRYHLTGKKLAKGLGILAKKYPHVFRDLFTGEGDMYTGDLLIQCSLFGEEKYC